jgi:hypothetical protein
VSVVVTAHYPEDLEEMCDNLILLRDARSRDLGSTQGLLQAESATLLLKFADPCARSVIRVQPEGKRLELLVEEINDATLRECRINRIDIERESLRSILLAENSTALVETGSESPTPDLQQKLDGRRTTCSGGRVLAAVTRSEWTILKRLRSPFIFMFGLPLALALVLGPAVSASRGPGASGRSLIDFAVLFSFFSVNLVGGSLYRETWQETWRRQALFGPPKPAFLFGKMAPVCALGLVEMLILAALGVTVFHLPVGNRFPLIIPVAVCLVLCGGSIGAFLYTVTRSSITFSNMSYLFLLIFGAAGGSIVVSNRLPSAIHELGYATPQYWGISSVVSLTTGHLSWRGYFEGLLIVLSLAILFFALAVWLLDYRTERINA